MRRRTNSVRVQTSSLKGGKSVVLPAILIYQGCCNVAWNSAIAGVTGSPAATIKMYTAEGELSSEGEASVGQHIRTGTIRRTYPAERRKWDRWAGHCPGKPVCAKHRDY
ncbi:hypothetical protein KM043_000325 [Ampulex compressa]|nr:hypothetical protein KM043_000325 [Ampulex compressa]